jgi:hypothetical protein
MDTYLSFPPQHEIVMGVSFNSDRPNRVIITDELTGEQLAAFTHPPAQPLVGVQFYRSGVNQGPATRLLRLQVEHQPAGNPEWIASPRRVLYDDPGVNTVIGFGIQGGQGYAAVKVVIQTSSTA